MTTEEQLKSIKIKNKRAELVTARCKEILVMGAVNYDGNYSDSEEELNVLIGLLAINHVEIHLLINDIYQ